jgi:hypothetical protein
LERAIYLQHPDVVSAIPPQNVACDVARIPEAHRKKTFGMPDLFIAITKP